MKKLRMMALIATLVITFAACSSSEAEEPAQTTEAATESQAAVKGDKSEGQTGERPEVGEAGAEAGERPEGAEAGGPGTGRGGESMPEFEGTVEIPEDISQELREMIESLPEQMQFMVVSQMPEEMTEAEEAQLIEKLEQMASGEMPIERSGKGGSHHDSGPSEDYTSSERIELDDSKTYADGTYTGMARGFNEGLTVSVTIEDNAITAISITDHNETPGFYEEAFEEVPDAIIEGQTTDVDTVSGATRSSEGIILAVEEALAKAEVTQ